MTDILEIINVASKNAPVFLSMVLLFVVNFLKKLEIIKKTWVIPIICVVSGMILYPLLNASSIHGVSEFTLNVLFGFLIGAGAVGIHQMPVQFQKRNDDK